MENKEPKITRVEQGEKVRKTVKKAAVQPQEAVAQEQNDVKPVQALTKAEEKSKAVTLRIVSAILWVLAIGCEVLAILCLFKALRLPGLSQMWWMIIFIVADLALCLVAGFLWKKASHLDPFKDDNKFVFFILTQLGLIMAAVCFLPLIILVLASKDKLDKKSKIVVTIVAVVALLVSGLLGADFNPISEKEKNQAEQTFADTEVYWTLYGHKYHLAFEVTDENGETHTEFCQAIRNSEKFSGTVATAIDNGCSELCSFCARDAAKAGIDLSGINLEGDMEVRALADNASDAVEDLTVLPEGD